MAEEDWGKTLKEQAWLQELGEALAPFIQLMEDKMVSHPGDLDTIWNGLPKRCWLDLYRMATGVGYDSANIHYPH